MLNALIHGKNREVAGVREAAVAEQALEICQHAQVAVRGGVDAVDEVRTGQVQAFPGNFRVFEAEKRFGLSAKKLFNAAECCGCHS